MNTKHRQGIAEEGVCARPGDRPRRGGRRTPDSECYVGVGGNVVEVLV